MEDLILIEKFFLIFTIYSVGGWIIEEIHCSISERKIVDRGFLIGPVCPIYGFGGIGITIFLTEFINRPIVVFCMAITLSAVIEYFTSLAMEKIFNARWWDYSEQKLNLNGRICIKTLIPFGLFGLIIIYILNPYIFNEIDKIPINTFHIATGIIFTIFLIDFIVSINVVSKVTSTAKRITTQHKDDTDEIVKEVKKELKQTFAAQRLLDAFPNFKTISVKIKEAAEKTAQKSMEVVEKTAMKSKEVVEKTAQKSKEIAKKQRRKIYANRNNRSKQ